MKIVSRPSALPQVWFHAISNLFWYFTRPTKVLLQAVGSFSSTRVVLPRAADGMGGGSQATHCTEGLAKFFVAYTDADCGRGAHSGQQRFFRTLQTRNCTFAVCQQTLATRFHAKRLTHTVGIDILRDQTDTWIVREKT